MLDGSSLALGGMGLPLAAVALALLERLAKVGFSRIPKLDADPAPLRTAAEIAYAYAREKRLPLAAVAERRSVSGDAAAWFESSLLKTVPVTATSSKTGAVRVLGLRARAGMCAALDGVAGAEDRESAYTDLMVSARDFRRYMRWVRTVW